MPLQEVKLRKHRSATREISYAEGFDAPGLEYKIRCEVVDGGYQHRNPHGVVVQDKKQTRWALRKFRVLRALYKQSRHRATAFWFCLALSAFVVSINKGVSTFPLSREDSLEVTFAIHEEHRRNLVSLKKAPIFDIDEDGHNPNYGGIERSNDSNVYEKYRSRFLDAIDHEEIPKSYHNDEDREDEERACRGPKWNSYIFPTCNSVHEHTIERVMGSGKEQDYVVKYLSSGTYRDAWRFYRPGVSEFVLKRYRLDDMFKNNYKDQKRVQKEAIVMERLSPSPRVLDIYGHCGTSVLLEAMAGDMGTRIVPGRGMIEQKVLDKMQKEDVHPMNKFNAEEKFKIALEMAESLADIHGFEGGQVIHLDIKNAQWLLAHDGSISVKLNDFNIAHISEWNEDEGKFCTTTRSYGGRYKAPEQFSGWSQNERVDVYAYGLNVYTLLTGLYAYYEVEDNDEIKKLVIDGELAYVDPRYRTRSYLEGKLVEIMERCWEYRRRERLNIFEVVEFLRNVKVEAEKNGELGTAAKHGIYNHETGRGVSV